MYTRIMYMMYILIRVLPGSATVYTGSASELALLYCYIIVPVYQYLLYIFYVM